MKIYFWFLCVNERMKIYFWYFCFVFRKKNLEKEILLENKQSMQN